MRRRDGRDEEKQQMKRKGDWQGRKNMTRIE